MNKKIFTTIIVLFTSLISQAQYPCLNGISTNPLNPINTQLPSKMNTFFNWQDSIYQVQPINSGCVRGSQMESPFFKIDNLEELRESKDMKWEDGWELIRRGFGLTDQNTNTTDPVPHVYFILYNKYTGILRVLLKTCNGADYNAAKITITFNSLSQIKTDLLEFSRGNVSPINKVFTNTSFAAGSKYVNDNTKWLYADFPMMFDPCTCIYKTKINIASDLISTSEIALEGSIAGDIYTKNVGGKAQIQKPGSISWKDISGFVNGKLSTAYGSVNNFVTQSQLFAENIGKMDTLNKKSALDNLGNFLKSNQFLKSGLNAVPWLKSAVGLVDIFIGGGKTTSGPQEVKLLPLSVNLTAKLNGTISITNPYHSIIFTNPGSKDAQLDPGAYPYYNEVLGIFNLLNNPTLYRQTNTAYRQDDNGNNVRINEHRFKLDLSTVKYVLNPAAGVSIQNMQAAIVIAGTNRNYPACAGAPFRIIPPDFTFEGKDASSGIEKFRSDYYDMNCLDQRILQANSFYNAIAGQNPVEDVGCPRVDDGAWIKFMINLKRNNATSTTQNILYVVTYPLNLVNYNITGNFTDNPSCVDSSIIAQASNAEINSLCNSSTYNNISRQSRAYIDSLVFEKQVTEQSIAISPNPNTGIFKIGIKAQKALLSKIIISDMLGRTAYVSNEGNLSLESGLTKQLQVNLNSGIYILTAISSKGHLKTKFVVVK